MAILETKDDVQEAYRAASKHIKPYFEPLAECERLARNKPHPNVVKAKLPTVTDGTLAAVVQAQPRRVIQQLPTGKVTSVESPELAMLVEFIWTNQILPNANTSGDPLQKSWIASTKAKTYGSQPSYQFFNNSGEYFGADFMLPYIKDVFPEPGKLNANDSEYMFMQSWWTKAQVKNLIEREKLLKRRAKERGEQYQSTWNLTALAELLDNLTPKDQEAKSPSEEKDEGLGYAHLVHAFQIGIGANFFTYSPRLDKIVRTRKNPDPRGCIPIKYLYDNIDLSNPLGRGAVELTGGMQNLLDSEVQAYQFMQKLMLNPPLKKWGSSIANSTIKWKPNAVWDMGDNPNSKLDPVQLSTDALRNFPTNYGLMKSQILNLTNNQDTSISAESGNPSFSKTQAGVQANQQRIAVDDNYFRKQFETWFEGVAENMLNIHFAESSGVREVELTEEFIKQTKLPADFQNEYFAMAGDNKAMVMYDAIKQKLHFEVDASTTQVKDDNEEKDRLLQLLELAVSNPLLGQVIKVNKLVERIVVKSGVEDPKELLPTEEELAAQAQAMQQQEMAMAQASAPVVPPTPAPAPMPQEQAPQPEIAPEDAEVIDGFMQAGFTQEQALMGVEMLKAGYSTEQIMQILTGAEVAA